MSASSVQFGLVLLLLVRDHRGYQRAEPSGQTDGRTGLLWAKTAGRRRRCWRPPTSCVGSAGLPLLRAGVGTGAVMSVQCAQGGRRAQQQRARAPNWLQRVAASKLCQTRSCPFGLAGRRPASKRPASGRIRWLASTALALQPASWSSALARQQRAASSKGEQHNGGRPRGARWRSMPRARGAAARTGAALAGARARGSSVRKMLIFPRPKCVRKLRDSQQRSSRTKSHLS